MLEVHSQVLFSTLYATLSDASSQLMIGAPRWLPEIKHGRLDVSIAPGAVAFELRALRVLRYKCGFPRFI